MCPLGYFADNTNKKCTKCDQECAECNGTTSLECKKCNNNKVINPLTNTCELSCPEGYFINWNNECEKCDDLCKTCYSEAQMCTSCAIDDYLLVNNLCVLSSSLVEIKKCEKGSYFDEKLNECRICDITCAECKSDSANDCTQCPGLRPYLKHGQCVANCLDNYFLNETTQTCLKCNVKCANCEKTSTYCTSCKPGYKLIQNECKLQLLEGIYFFKKINIYKSH